MYASFGGSTSPLSSLCVATMTPKLPCCYCKGVLPDVLDIALLVKEFYIECLGEVLPIEMEVGSLYSPAIRHYVLYAVACNRSREISPCLLFFPSIPGSARYSFSIFMYISRITFLSAIASFSVANTVCPSFHRNSLDLMKWSWMLEFPSEHVVPLVVSHWKISPGSYPFRIASIHYCL